MTVKHTTDANFRTDVLESDKPVLVDFWATWCGPCVQMGPVLEAIDAAHSDEIQVVKIDVDQNPATAQHYGISSIPAFKVFKGGEVVKELVGSRPKAVFEAEIKPYFAAETPSSTEA